MSPTRTLKWPERSRVQITRNTSSAYHVQHVCHVVRRGSSAIEFDRVEIAFILALFYCLKPLTDISNYVPLQSSYGSCPCKANRLAGPVVKASASGAEDPGFVSRLRRDFSGSSRTSDLKTGTPVATLPGAWCHRVSAGTGLPGVDIL